MADRKLALWVEGRDDRLFFERCMRQELNKLCDSPIIKEYAAMPKGEIKKLFRGLTRSGYDQIIFGDIDSCQCPTQKKEILRNNRFGAPEETPIFIVVREIESWFLAGLDEQGLRRLAIPPKGNTDQLSKDQFDNALPKKFRDSRIDFLVELTKVFSFEAARSNNTSFRYFADKVLVPSRNRLDEQGPSG